MPYPTEDLSGRVIAITGASAGIGRETALLLAEAGVKVVLGARRVERLEELVEQIGADNALAVPLDVRDAESNRAFVAAAIERFGRLDGLVANAGIGVYGGIMDATDEQVDAMLETNLTGTVWGVRAAVPHLRENGGDIIIVASVAGSRGDANEAVYAASKHGQVGLAGALDRELRREGIRVTALCPAGVTTEFAIGTGRTEGDPTLEVFLQPEDIAFQVLTCLRQPRRMRSTSWTIWSMAHALP